MADIRSVGCNAIQLELQEMLQLINCIQLQLITVKYSYPILPSFRPTGDAVSLLGKFHLPSILICRVCVSVILFVCL